MNPLISSLPIHALIHMLHPAPPENVLGAADDFHYRDFLTVALILRGTNLFPDNWIYVHDPNVKVGRIQNYNNWSPEMVPDPSTTCLGLEYFCSEGDLVWTMKDCDCLWARSRSTVVKAFSRLHAVRGWNSSKEGLRHSLRTAGSWKVEMMPFSKARRIGRARSRRKRRQPANPAATGPSHRRSGFHSQYASRRADSAGGAGVGLFS